MAYTTFSQTKNDQLKEPMFFGQPVNVARYDQQKYDIFEKLIEKQLSFFWRPEEVDVSRDRIDYQSLPDHEKHIFISNLKYQTLLVEDDPYGELRYDGDKVPSLKSMDTKGNIIFLGSFSKILMPGLRIAWMVADPVIIDKVVKLKQAVDLQSSSFGQRQTSYYIDMFDLDEHVAKIKALYKKRRDLMCESMKKYFPEGITFTYPEGGLFTWVTLPEGMDAKELMPKVLAKNVAYVPGGPFYPHGGNANHFRLNYSNMPEDRIVEGIKRLAEVLKEKIGK